MQSLHMLFLLCHMTLTSHPTVSTMLILKTYQVQLGKRLSRSCLKTFQPENQGLGRLRARPLTQYQLYVVQKGDWLRS